MYYVPEGTTRCGYYECESCGEKFLSLQTMEHINCPYCEAEFDPVLPLPVEISSGYNVCTDEAISWIRK